MFNENSILNDKDSPNHQNDLSFSIKRRMPVIKKLGIA